jgi:uncharacterized delta-60 repeat protein
MKLFIFSTIILFFFISTAISQVHQDWVQRFNGPGNADDAAYALAIDGSGNVYVTGSTYAEGTGRNYATVKYNSSGVQQWVNIYNGPGNADDEAYAIAVDGSGNVYITGFSRGIYEDFATIKYNSSGIQVWAQRYNGPANSQDIARSIAVDASGNVYVTGFSTGSGTNTDIATIKYNPSGVQQCVQRYNNSSNNFDAGYCLVLDGSANIYVTGCSSLDGTNFDCLTVKYNSSGVQQWVQRYNGPANGEDYGSAVTVDVSGNVYVTGHSMGSGTGYDILTIKYNPAGIQQWVQKYNGPGNSLDQAYSLAADGSGNVYVAGWSMGSGTDVDYASIKYNTSGAQQWVQRYDGIANTFDGANSIAVDGSGNVYVTGESCATAANSDYVTIKYNTSGVQQWLQRYDGPGNGNDRASVIAVDASGNVYVTGRSLGSGPGNDFCTIKYSQQIGIKKISSEIPDKFSLSQNYPNPFNPSTSIEFDIPLSPLSERGVGGLVSLNIYDILGREVESLVNEELKAGSYTVNFNADRLSSGVYYYKLATGDFNQTRRMVVLK